MKTKTRKAPVKKTARRKTTRKKAPVKSMAIIAAPVPDKDTTLSLTNTSQVLKFAKHLQAYVKQNSLTVTIQDKVYPLVDAWKYTGMHFGLTALPKAPVKISADGTYIIVLYAKQEFEGKKGKYWKEVPVFVGSLADEKVTDHVRKMFQVTRQVVKPYYAYSIECEVIRLSDGKVLSTGTSICTNMESAKVSFDQNAICAMAQTRVISRTYRNLLGFVMTAADLEPTPGEEMSTDGDGWQEADVVGTNGTKAQVNTNAQEKARTAPTEGQFREIFKKVHAKQVSIDEVDKYFILTEAQRKSLEYTQKA